MNYAEIISETDEELKRVEKKAEAGAVSKPNTVFTCAEKWHRAHASRSWRRGWVEVAPEPKDMALVRGGRVSGSFASATTLGIWETIEP